MNELAEISNRIFKRNEYAGYSSEDSGLEFDIPLRKLIVFAGERCEDRQPEK